MRKYKCSAIERSPYPVQTSKGLKHVYVITDEEGQTYTYEKEFRCDAATHVSLAVQTNCLRCPKCKQLLRRDRSEWGKESVDGLGFLKIDSRQDAELVLGMLNEKLTKAESPKDRSSILTAITKMLHVLGRAPEMLEVATQNHD